MSFSVSSNASLSGLIGGELLSTNLDQQLAFGPAQKGLFAIASQHLQGAMQEAEPQWSDEARLTASQDFYLDGFEVLAQRYAVSPSYGSGYIPSYGAAIAPGEDSLIGAMAGVTYAPSFAADPASATPSADQGGNSLAAATNVGLLEGAVTVNDFVGTSDRLDFYRVAVNQNSTVSLSLTGLDDDANIYLVRDFNGNRAVEDNEILALSELEGRAAESFDFNVRAGAYHVAVAANSARTNYSLNLATAGLGRTQQVIGNLEANRFEFNPAATRSIFSGNGNIDFGSGQADFVDMSSIDSSSVRDWNIAGQTGYGVAYNDGSGTRIFDAMTLANGQQILFEGMDGVQFADQAIPLFVKPNDPGFDQQWNLHMMGVHNAWRFTTGSDEVAIGVGDSGLGVDAAGRFHPDLRQTKLITSSTNTPDEMFRLRRDSLFGPRSSSHGTAVHGIIAAQSNNGIGISGINWESTTINVDVDIDDNFNDLSLAQATQTMIDIADSQEQNLVINLSLSYPDSIESIVRNNSNTLFVIASGNDGHQQFGISTPAILAERYENVIAVGASWGRADHFGNERMPGQRIDYRYTGDLGQQTNWGSQYGPGLTLMGPSEVMSTRAKNTGTQASFDFYTPEASSRINPQFNGTSAAAPNVSGVASLVWSANSSLKAGQIKQILAETAYRNISGYNQFEYGSGFVNADAAVRRAVAMA